jgi:hypothetical protein
MLQLPADGTMVLASIDSFWIMVAIAIGSAVLEWVQKRRQAKGGEGPGERPVLPSPPEAEQPAPVPGDWQEELRRMLDGSGPRPAPPSPPPVPTVLEPAPERPPPISQPRPFDDAPPPVLKPTRPVVIFPTSPDPEPELAPAPSMVLADFRESEAAHQRANSIDVLTADRLQVASARTDHHPIRQAMRPTRNAPPDVKQIHAWLKDPRTARQVMAASFILGPPRALEPDVSR